MNTLIIDNKLLDTLLTKANDNPRFRLNYDLRTSVDDQSQRMLNALLSGTEVVIHRHPNSSESVVCLCGRMDEKDTIVIEGHNKLREGSKIDLKKAGK